MSTASEDSGKNGLKTFQQDATEVLSSLPSLCTVNIETLVLAAQTTALYQSSNCSVSVFTKAVENIYIVSAEYVSKVLEIVTTIGMHFTGCAAELIPLNVIVCVFKSVLELFTEVRHLIYATFRFVGNILTLIPPLLSDIESCFSNSTENYQLVMRGLVHKAKVCEATLTA